MAKQASDNVFSGSDMFPQDPPLFLRRTPHGYFDTATIRSDLAKAGFTKAADVTTLARRSRAVSASVTAVAFCCGTPFLNEITARDPSRLDEATERAENSIAARFGNGAVRQDPGAHHQRPALSRIGKRRTGVDLDAIASTISQQIALPGNRAMRYLPPDG